jgi:hypothetical protein
MSLAAFVEALIDGGPLVVGADLTDPAGIPDAIALLDDAARAELAFDGPKVDPAVTEWALVMLFRAAQSLVYRELEADWVTAALGQSCPKQASPAVCYSADLAFRFLPDLTDLARGIAADDPLVAGLANVSARWPLSSVGMRDLQGPIDPSPFIDHPALRRLYADRIIERADASRLSDPCALEAVREALGGHPELAPKLEGAFPT